jgi:hypothetical protein
VTAVIDRERERERERARKRSQDGHRACCCASQVDEAVDEAVDEVGPSSIGEGEEQRECRHQRVCTSHSRGCRCVAQVQSSDGSRPAHRSTTAENSTVSDARTPNTCSRICRQTDRQTDEQTDEHTDEQTDEHT